MSWTGWPRRSGPVRAGSWWCAVIRAWARPCCWTTWPDGPRPPGAGWPARWACSRRWNSHSPGLHQLCAPMLNRAERLPVPQRDALRTAFGLASGPPPDRFFVGLAVLSLLSGVAGDRPLICLIDDEQWLDRASAQALGFVARRLAADPVGLVFAAREPGAELAALPELIVDGLQDDDARALLDSALPGPLDARVRDLIIAETQGNPLALLELPRGLTPAAAGRRVRAARRGSADQPDRGQLPSAAGRPAGRDPAAVAAGGGRSVWRPVAGQASRRAAAPADPGRGAGGRGGPGGVRHAGSGSGIRWSARRPTGRRRSPSGSRCTPRWRR